MYQSTWTFHLSVLICVSFVVHQSIFTYGLPSQETCKKDDFKCRDGLCVPSHMVCDGFEDCLDASDEYQCTNVSCSTTEFLCAHTEYCVAKSYLCDGVDDCGDASDEEDCGSESVHGSCMNKKDHRLCADHSNCVHISHMCDAVNDCTDGSDELNNCSTLCEALHCESACLLDGDNVNCACPEGYTLDNNGKTCTDINECNVSDSKRICSQICYNIAGLYRCRCHRGYDLQKDGQTCKAEGDAPYIFFALPDVIKAFELGQDKVSVLYEENKGHIRGLAADSSTKLIFWSESDKHGRPAIFSLELGQPSYKKKLIASFGLSQPGMIALDYLQHNLYVVDSNQVVIVNTLTKNMTVVLSSKVVDKPKLIALHPRKGLMFWTEAGKPSKIMMSSMDGSNIRVFPSEHVGQVGALMVDETVDRLYWSDESHEVVDTAKLDGSDHIIIFDHEMKKPVTLNSFENSLITWSSKLNYFVTTDKFSGATITRVGGQTPEPVSAMVIHSSLQNIRVRNPCSSNFCSHICLIKENYASACACPPNHVLDDWGQGCEEKEDSGSLYVAYEKGILQFPVEYYAHVQAKNLSTGNVQHVFAMAYVGHGELVFSNIDSHGKSSILKLDITTPGSSPQKLVENVGSVNSIAVDKKSWNLYWVDSFTSTLHVKLDLEYPKRLRIPGVTVPLSVAVSSEPRYLVFSSMSPPTIQRCHLSGQNCKVLISKTIKRPNFVLSEISRVFYTDADLGLVSSVFLNGTGRKLHASTHGRPLALARNGKILFWVEQGAQTIFYTDWTVTGETSRFTDVVIPKPAGLLMIPEFGFFDLINECYYMGTCDQGCFSYPNGDNFTCVCGDGYKLDNDSKSCSKVEVDCAGFYCFDHSGCIEKEKRCDTWEDCIDGSDEHNCPATKCEFLCSDGHCIQEAYVCDMEQDCRDGGDENEQLCKGKYKCGQGMFQCDGGRCLKDVNRCDGVIDCQDGTDEENCKCEDDEFRCEDGECITSSWKCDGEPDCNGKDDEADCGSVECGDDQHPCKDGSCIYTFDQCDGFADCSEGEDEKNCPEEICDIKDYKCLSGSCIARTQLCDKHSDCPGSDDEWTENCFTGCKSGQVECDDGSCISSLAVCDGTRDCADGSDESSEDCKEENMKPPKVTQPPPHPCDGQFVCTVGSCVEQDKICDGLWDCPDGSDEAVCEKTCKTWRRCSQICTDSPTGPICSCNPGFNQTTNTGYECEDINECKVRNGGCSQRCINTKGSYECTCVSGYRHGADKNVCKARGDRPYLLVSFQYGFKQISMHGSAEHESIRVTTFPAMADVRLASSDVWFLRGEDSGKSGLGYTKILNQKLPSRTSSPQISFDSPPGSLITSLAVDWLTNNLYLGLKQFQKSTITVMNPANNASLYKHILTKSSKSGRGLESLLLHPLKGQMYWFALNNNQHGLFSASMDGANERILYEFPANSKPSSLSMDPATNRLYWINAGKKWSVLESSNMEGRDRWAVSHLAGHSVGLDVFEGFAIVTDIGSGHVNKIKTFDDYSTSLVKKISHPGAVKVMHTMKQPIVHHGCENQECQFTCVLSANGGHCVCGETQVSTILNPTCRGPPVVPKPSTKATTSRPKTQVRLEPEAVNTTPLVRQTPRVVTQDHRQRPRLNPSEADPNKLDRTSKCSLKCQNGGNCTFTEEGNKTCRCSADYSGLYCEKLAPKSDSSSLAWIAAIVVVIVAILVACSVFWYFRFKNDAHRKFLRTIRFQHTALQPEKVDNQTVVPEISFGNPGFQDEIDAEASMDEDQDWWKKLLSKSRGSLDSALASGKGGSGVVFTGLPKKRKDQNPETSDTACLLK